jgi:tRNA (guanine-N7-)-methyltransferase
MAAKAPPWEAIPRFDLGDWWKEESLPLEFSKYCDCQTVSVEIGFGHGEFLHEMAKANRESLYIGVEQFGEGLRKLIRSLKNERTENCLPLMGNGFIVMQVLFEDSSVSDIYVNFPDPWPKKRHQNRRLFVEEFFALAARKLRTGGVLHLATDHRELAGQALEEMGKVRSFENMNKPDAYLRESPYPFKTRYEQKWMKEGRELFYFAYERTKCLT